MIHYYKEPHPYYDHDVMVIGAKNSAAIAALELFWTGARVTLVHRGPEIHRHVKYWIKPNIENRIKNGEMKAYFNSQRGGDPPEGRRCSKRPKASRRSKNDFVFAMIGYRPDLTFLNATGITLDPKPSKPRTNPETLESERQGRLPRRRDRGGNAHQRNLHRKRPLPRRRRSQTQSPKSWQNNAPRETASARYFASCLSR